MKYCDDPWGYNEEPCVSWHSSKSGFCDRLGSNKSYKFEFSDFPSSPMDTDIFEIGSLLPIFITTILFTDCLEHCRSLPWSWASSLSLSNSFSTWQPVLEPHTNRATLQLKILWWWGPSSTSLAHQPISCLLCLQHHNVGALTAYDFPPPLTLSPQILGCNYLQVHSITHFTRI